VGYITPLKDIDFNVIIRSILMNQSNRHLSMMAGSAITIESDPESEYDECLLKSEALKKIL
jgi:para-aminobenzoate synthetase component 1